MKVGSYLLEITKKILQTKDNKPSASSASKDSSAGHLLAKISDSCGSKGTGKWTVIEAAERGVSVPTISAALGCRYISALVSDRATASTMMQGPREVPMVMRQQIVADLKLAMYIFTMSVFAQGFAVIQRAYEDLQFQSVSNSNDSNSSLSSNSSRSGVDNILRSCCEVWKGGCIIRNALLPEMSNAFDRNPQLPNLLLDNIIAHKSNRFINSARRIATYMIASGIPCPAILACISYYDCLRSANLSTNLIQVMGLEY
jgi:6-phosphogluconate dehydrogenase